MGRVGREAKRRPPPGSSERIRHVVRHAMVKILIHGARSRREAIHALCHVSSPTYTIY